MGSVRAWAELQGYDYQFVGDELFERVPDWYRDKVGERTPILADLARLRWMKHALTQVEHVVWLDADTLVFRPVELGVVMGDLCFWA